MTELFDAAEYRVEIPEQPVLTLGQRQRDKITAGLHPLSGTGSTGSLRLAPEGTGTCGSCVHRRSVATSYRGQHPKCLYGKQRLPDSELSIAPRVAHSEQTDCRAWWPACTDYEGASNGRT